LKLSQPVEIDKGGLRRLLFNDFHKLLEKAYAKDATAFSQFQQARPLLRELPL
jgi:hypothetical protein